MRLWHEKLIHLLPKNQLLGQHRECCTLRGNGWKKKHKTVDYVFSYSPQDSSKLLTQQINLHVREEEKLAVFDRNSVYLPTKKICKNNPPAEEIRADNEVRQDWNRTADLALVVGVPEEKVLETKHEEIQNRGRDSIFEHGWLPTIRLSVQ